ncbi:putative aldo/keto reductase [Gordonia polyisoprenivorans VH2]|uniref:Aldo/keto reductase n=2 Tax=Gordonia polyisoprenivorans TaxID=84595 RepID=A0A846WKK2_9ACTN|nr:MULTISPECIES: aldo/keto reductase [Gordonia]AFA71513.1 putative aldo/keto reductase [Gordonia polyisoprenivorans VH2]MBE7191484.1 aldo/keto reductase [Gordonia polyisoprenivorans]MDF3285419.1 aldo/keto reductase [Gordonia sp. N1V]NKY00861.1 aldo/keto reductase [Gordonia polyisoprenivorans]OPX17132.1 aldo/keto reductase [Gordonia sp. i37]
MDIPSVTLASGFALPLVGLGTFDMLGMPCAQAVSHALDSGYRLLDTASRYSNELSVGMGIEESQIDRSEVIVQTKLGGGDQGFDEAITAAKESARRLGVSWIDVYLIHWPCPSLGRMVDSWKALLTLADEGFIRVPGVSNFREHHLQALYDETGRWPEVNQIQCSPALARGDLRQFMQDKGIHAQAWHPTGRKEGMLGDATIIRLARKYGKSPTQIALRWAVQQEIGVVPKSSHKGRQLENIDLFDFELDAGDLTDLEELDRGEGAARNSDIEEEF